MLESRNAGGTQRSLLRGLIPAAIALQLGSALGGEIVVGQVTVRLAPGGYAAIAALFAATASFIGGSPNMRPYSRVNCDTLS